MLANTQTTISCVVNGLTKQLDTVTWEKPSGVGITHNVDGFLIEVGTFDVDTKSQTTVLTIPATQNTADNVYRCVRGGGQWRKMANNGEKWRKMAMANSAFSFVKFAIFRHFLILEFHI